MMLFLEHEIKVGFFCPFSALELPTYSKILIFSTSTTATSSFDSRNLITEYTLYRLQKEYRKAKGT